ncbi:MAG: NAD(P)-binding domain-containing protein, partial [Gemmatimonadetes bacterium]|nr:NAD(P)-binding domain-containing protein [Gemmatimonadota bacterium]NNL30224.1 NAD(P)-binding domain-containing protein [Gemmatimonadota bacterium]
MTKIAVLGGGNLGRALATGWVAAGHVDPADVHVTRRETEKLDDLADVGFVVSADNATAVDA